MVVEGMEGKEVEEELLQVERLVEWLVEKLEGKVVEEGMVGMVLVVGRIELNWHCHHY